MRARIRGINTVRRRLADGSVRIHYYHRLSGVALTGEPGTPEFLASIAEAERKYRADRVPQDQFRSVVVAYRQMPEFTELAGKTRKDYERILRTIEDEFGDTPLAAFGDHRIRGDFFEWRDKIAKRSLRMADYSWSVLRRVIQVAYNRGKVSYNHAQEGGRLYASDRADKIWSADEVNIFMAKAPYSLQCAMLVALYTGQRQGDILRLTWGNYDGEWLRLRQSKTKRRVEIKVAEPLRRLLDILKENRKAATILTDERDQPWKADNFRSRWAHVCSDARIVDRHFHDLRGTAATLMRAAGSDAETIASIFGWSAKTAGEMLDTYTTTTPEGFELASKRLEAALEKNFSGIGNAIKTRQHN